MFLPLIHSHMERKRRNYFTAARRIFIEILFIPCNFSEPIELDRKSFRCPIISSDIVQWAEQSRYGWETLANLMCLPKTFWPDFKFIASQMWNCVILEKSFSCKDQHAWCYTNLNCMMWEYHEDLRCVCRAGCTTHSTFAIRLKLICDRYIYLLNALEEGSVADLGE